MQAPQPLAVGGRQPVRTLPAAAATTPAPPTPACGVPRADTPPVRRQSSDPSDVLARAWRAALPRQAPLAHLATVIAAHACRARVPDGRLAAAARQLLDDIPALSALAWPDALRQAVCNAGLFLEARLAAGERGLETDLKAQCLRLAVWARRGLLSATAAAEAAGDEAQAKEDMAKILQHAEAALARIQCNQLATLASSGGEGMPAAWFIELPVRDRDSYGTLRLRLVAEERDTVKAATTPAAWNVALDLDLASLGPIHVRIQVHGERAGVVFWAQRASTVERLRAHLQALRTELHEAGLEAGILDCHDGPPPSPPDAGLPCGALDERV